MHPIVNGCDLLGLKCDKARGGEMADDDAQEGSFNGIVLRRRNRAVRKKARNPSRFELEAVSPDGSGCEIYIHFLDRLN